MSSRNNDSSFQNGDQIGDSYFLDGKFVNEKIYEQSLESRINDDTISTDSDSERGGRDYIRRESQKDIDNALQRKRENEPKRGFFGWLFSKPRDLAEEAKADLEMQRAIEKREFLSRTNPESNNKQPNNKQPNVQRKSEPPKGSWEHGHGRNRKTYYISDTGQVEEFISDDDD